MPKLATFPRFGRAMLAALDRTWSRIWFQNSSTSPLEIARIGIGAALLLHYGLAIPYLSTFWGDAGWMPRDLVFDGFNSWTQSVFFYFSAPWQLVAFHALFLFCCAAFMVGWRTAWVKWIVLIGQISYEVRNPGLFYGVDKILAGLLFILCFAPIGHAMSLDRVRTVRAAKRSRLMARPPRYTSPWAGACTRLMQIQMVMLFFYSGIEKLRGDDWWYGNAIWSLFTSNEYYSPLLLDLMARHFWLSNVATYSTLLIEIAFPFLIWQRRTRPYLLAAAIFLHLQFAIFMALYYFSFVMVMGHMSFVRPEWLARLGEAWKRRIGQAGDDLRRQMRLLRPVDGVAFGFRWPRADQDPQFSQQSFSRRQRREIGKSALPRAARRPRASGLRGLSLHRAAGAGIVVADPVLLRAGAEPSVRPSDLQLGRIQPRPALGLEVAKAGPVSAHAWIDTVATQCPRLLPASPVAIIRLNPNSPLPNPTTSTVAQALVMISKKLRSRLIYSAMSLFVGWHTLAMILGPAPDDSPTIESLRFPFQPYLNFFKLQNTWAFFDDISRSHQLRYVIKDAAGKQHTFVPIDDFEWFHPRYNWFKITYWAVMESPELYGEHFAISSCRKHAALKPTSVELLLVRKRIFGRRICCSGIVRWIPNLPP